MKPNRAAACRFFSHGQAVLIAMDAYVAASHAVEPPDGECWFDDNGQPWSSYTAWAESFIQAMCDGVARLAVERQIPFESDSTYPGLSWSDNAPFATLDNRGNNRSGSGAGND